MREQWLESLHESEIMRNVKMRHDYILVDPDPDRNYARVPGPDGKFIDLMIDTNWSKEHNSMSGRIVCLPEQISSQFKFDLNHLQLGDRVYFHFNCLEIAREAGYGVVDEKGYQYLGIHVDLLYCAVRNGEIMMIADNILVKPVEEKESELRTKSGIWMKSAAGKKALEGIVACIGENNGAPVEISVGDHIIFDTDCEYEILVEGQKYYKQKHNEVLAKFTK